MNTLALRTEVLGDMSFADLLQHVRATTVEAYANQEAPFEKVVDAVVKDRDMSRSPLFQVMLVLQNTPEIPELRLGDIQLSREIFEHNTSKFEITFFVKETADGLQGSVEYRTDLYSDQKIRGMIAHFLGLLNAVVATPDELIGNLGMLLPRESQALTSGFNVSEAAYPTDKSVVDLFEQQVSKPLRPPPLYLKTKR